VSLTAFLPFFATLSVLQPREPRNCPVTSSPPYTAPHISRSPSLPLLTAITLAFSLSVHCPSLLPGTNPRNRCPSPCITCAATDPLLQAVLAWPVTCARKTPSHPPPPTPPPTPHTHKQTQPTRNTSPPPPCPYPTPLVPVAFIIIPFNKRQSAPPKHVPASVSCTCPASVVGVAHPAAPTAPPQQQTLLASAWRGRQTGAHAAATPARACICTRHMTQADTQHGAGQCDQSQAAAALITN
jgi:hypothetical protein